MSNPPYGVIKQGLRAGTIIPFLGAGASLGERDPMKEPWKPNETRGLPLGAELSQQLAKTASLDPVPPDLATAAQYFEYQAGRELLDETLDGWLGLPTKAIDQEPDLPRLHRFLAGLPGPIVIVTTNYDDLLETAFDAAGHAYDLISYSNGSNGAPDSLLFWEHGRGMREVPANEFALTRGRSVIYKFHGFRKRMAEPTSQYVITEDDYIDFLSRMVSTSAIPHALTTLFRSHPFLFLGYGLADWNLRLLLNRVSRGRTKSLKSWAIQHQVEPFERPIWEQRQVNLYELGLTEFLNRLEEE